MTCLMCRGQRVARSDAIYCSRSCTMRAANLRLNYGLDPQGYWKLINEQGNACAACSCSFAEVAPHVDHCHRTGRVRGILCSACNRALGILQEDRDRIFGLADYVESHCL